MRTVRTFVLGFCVYFCPPLFLIFARRWFPVEYSGDKDDQHERTARTLRRRFWRGFALSAGVVAAVLVAQWWRLDGIDFGRDDWLRVVAVVMVLTAALGRGGWTIQSWDGDTVVERIDRGMHVIAQLGAAMLLVFVLTL